MLTIGVGPDAAGGTAAATVTWSATGGTISQSGNYTAGSTPGENLVIAAGQGVGLADTAFVTIPEPPPPDLVAIELTPPAATVQSGLTQTTPPPPCRSRGRPRVER